MEIYQIELGLKLFLVWLSFVESDGLKELMDMIHDIRSVVVGLFVCCLLRETRGKKERTVSALLGFFLSASSKQKKKERDEEGTTTFQKGLKIRLGDLNYPLICESHFRSK
jgi:hypothetical protein